MGLLLGINYHKKIGVVSQEFWKKAVKVKEEMGEMKQCNNWI